MSHARNVPKDRFCRTCQTLIRRVTAAELKVHAKACASDADTARRMSILGLTVPKMSIESAEILGKLR